MTRFLIALVFLVLPFRALAVTVSLEANDTPIGLAAEADGTLWFVTFGSVGRIRTTGEVERVAIPIPFVVERHAPIHVLGDGSVLVGSYNGVIARVDANMKATLIHIGDSGDGVRVFADGPDGSVLFGGHTSGSEYSGGFLGRLTADGVVTRTRIPVSIQAAAVGPDGTLYFTAIEGIYRMTPKGALEQLAVCRCYRSWLVVTADGTLWFSGGRLPPDGTVVWQYYGGQDATLGPDGRVWVAGDSNSLRVLNADGSIQEIPFATSEEVPHSIASTQRVVWYGVRGAVRSQNDDGGFVGRVNICTGGPLAPFLENLTERPLNLRITRNGDVLVVYWRHLVRYDAAGRVLSELKPSDDTSFASVALDPDPRFIWIGSLRQLARVEWASGIVVERVPVYGTPSRISVVGEPRAARFPERRRVPRP